MKKLLSIFVILALIFSLMTVSALADLEEEKVKVIGVTLVYETTKGNSSAIPGSDHGFKLTDNKYVKLGRVGFTEGAYFISYYGEGKPHSWVIYDADGYVGQVDVRNGDGFAMVTVVEGKSIMIRSQRSNTYQYWEVVGAGTFRIDAQSNDFWLCVPDSYTEMTDEEEPFEELDPTPEPDPEPDPDPDPSPDPDPDPDPSPKPEHNKSKKSHKSHGPKCKDDCEEIIGDDDDDDDDDDAITVGDDDDDDDDDAAKVGDDDDDDDDAVIVGDDDDDDDDDAVKAGNGDDDDDNYYRPYVPYYPAVVQESNDVTEIEDAAIPLDSFETDEDDDAFIEIEDEAVPLGSFMFFDEEQVPLSESPFIEIEEEAVPLAIYPEAVEETVFIFDGIVPLAELPKTGVEDMSLIYMIGLGFSLMGAAISLFAIVRKGREQA